MHGVGVDEPQRQSVRRAAEGPEVVERVVGAQVGCGRVCARSAPVQPAAAEVQVAHARERADGRGTELLDLLLAPRAARRGVTACAASRANASSSSRSKQRWKYSATTGRSASSHLLTNDSRNASAGSWKISMFSAQVITVRGDISVDRSPAREALAGQVGHAPPSSATSARPAASASDGTRASTIAISSSRGQVVRAPRRCSSGRSARG